MSETEPERPAPEAEPAESPEEEVIFGPDTTEEDEAGAAG